MDTIINVTALLANICVLLLTWKTFSLTTLSNKINFISLGFSTSMFNGDTISLSLENTTLRPISISSVSLVKKMDDGAYHLIDLIKYSEPYVIEARRVAKITTRPYTYIDGIDSVTDLHKNAIICIKSASKILFVKPYKKAPLKEVKKLHKKQHYFEPLTVVREEFNNQVISQKVRYAVCIRAGENACEWNTLLLTEHGHLNETICGYNGLDASQYNSGESLMAYLTNSFNIPMKDIYVHVFQSHKI